MSVSLLPPSHLFWALRFLRRRRASVPASTAFPLEGSGSRTVDVDTYQALTVCILARDVCKRVPPGRVLGDTAMTEKFAPPMVTIRRYAASRVCDVVVVVRGQEMVIRCPSYSQAVKWARLERRSSKIPEPITDFPDSEKHDDLPP